MTKQNNFVGKKIIYSTTGGIKRTEYPIHNKITIGTICINPVLVIKHDFHLKLKWDLRVHFIAILFFYYCVIQKDYRMMKIFH